MTKTNKGKNETVRGHGIPLTTFAFAEVYAKNRLLKQLGVIRLVISKGKSSWKRLAMLMTLALAVAALAIATTETMELKKKAILAAAKPVRYNTNTKMRNFSTDAWNPVPNMVLCWMNLTTGSFWFRFRLSEARANPRVFKQNTQLCMSFLD